MRIEHIKLSLDHKDIPILQSIKMKPENNDT